MLSVGRPVVKRAEGNPVDHLHYISSKTVSVKTCRKNWHWLWCDWHLRTDWLTCSWSMLGSLAGWDAGLPPAAVSHPQHGSQGRGFPQQWTPPNTSHRTTTACHIQYQLKQLLLLTHSTTHNVTLLWEYPQFNTLRGHPLQGKFHGCVLTRLTKVVSHVDIFCQTKVSYFNDAFIIDPVVINRH